MNNFTPSKNWEIQGQSVGSAITKKEVDFKSYKKAIEKATKESQKLQETIDSLYALKPEKSTYDSTILIESIIKNLFLL